MWVVGMSLIVVLVVGVVTVRDKSEHRLGLAATTTPSEMYGMREYADPAYGFSFWYPGALTVAASTMDDAVNFPGGVAVEVVTIGHADGLAVIVVDSPSSSITDEPRHHASPIAQTKYFFDSALGRWMVAYPEGPLGTEQRSSATTTADVSETTIGGLTMLRSGRRFDTTIIPLSTTRFVVVTDGGGSSFTHQLAQTVAPVGVPIDPSVQDSALKAEAAAYDNGIRK